MVQRFRRQSLAQSLLQFTTPHSVAGQVEYYEKRLHIFERLLTRFVKYMNL